MPAVTQCHKSVVLTIGKLVTQFVQRLVTEFLMVFQREIALTVAVVPEVDVIVFEFVLHRIFETIKVCPYAGVRTEPRNDVRVLGKAGACHRHSATGKTGKSTMVAGCNEVFLTDILVRIGQILALHSGNDVVAQFLPEVFRPDVLLTLTIAAFFADVGVVQLLCKSFCLCITQGDFALENHEESSTRE